MMEAITRGRLHERAKRIVAMTGVRALSSETSASTKSPFSPVSKQDLRKKFPKPLKVKQYGINILHDPLFNKGLAFDLPERDRLGLRGLVPAALRTLEDQVLRTKSQIDALPDDTMKNMALQDLHDRNETLYHKLLVDYIEEMAPLVYTPTVGIVCQRFGYNFHRSRGMYFSRNDRGHFSSMVHNWPHKQVQVIVVTDGSRILGLGDLGAHGMGIPIGKLALYCAAGGIAPHRVLPVCLDVGTNNQKLLDDPSYVGVKERRLEGKEYFDLVDEFMSAVISRWPDCVIQFEDFETPKAEPLLKKYRELRVFNDDIQGTGSVALSAIMSAAKNANSKITDMRFLCAGAGSAGLGVCSMIVDGLVAAGLTKEEAMKRFVVCTEHGAIGKKDGTKGDPNYKAGYVNERAHPWVNDAVADGTSMVDVMNIFKPTVLMGMTTKAKVFNEELIRTMAKHCERPIIMPMSNPTSRAECTPEEAYRWTDGRAVVATGSPFDPVTLPDGRTMIPSQCNNMYIFPGLGLATSVTGAPKITDHMLYAASEAVVNCMTNEERAEGRTFPRLRRIREVSHTVACAVAEEAIKSGLCNSTFLGQIKRESVADLLQRKMYYPEYVTLVDPSSDT